MRRMSAKLIVLAAVASAAMAITPAMAENIDTIYLANLRLAFANGEIVANPTALDAIQFMKDGVEVGFLDSWDTDVSADIRILGVPDLPENNPTAIPTSGVAGSYIDLLDSGNTILHLPVNQLNAWYTSSGGIKTVTLSGIIAGPISYDFSAYDLTINPGDVVSVQLVADNLTTSENPLTGFPSTSGTGHITFTPVPEPSLLIILLGLAASALVARAWRRRRSG